MLAPKLAAARAAGVLSRAARRGGGTSLPGKVLMRLEPDAIGLLAGRLARGSAVISATNGKTTTAAMVASVLERGGAALVHNRAGANMAGGVASALLSAAERRGRIAGDTGLFEVDEMWLDRLVPELAPRGLLLGNLFRDQLDRYGELESIAERWGALVAGLPRSTRLVLNADDPLVADLGRERPDAVYFGLDDDSVALEALAHAADSKHCRRCGAPYVYTASHLGRYECPVCGARRPDPEVRATDVVLEGVRAARFTLHAPAGSAPVALPLPGLYNVYNALGAAALCLALGARLEDVVGGLESVEAAFGRAERIELGGREVAILLVKNPAGANEVLRTLALEGEGIELYAVLNDGIADGRDVSWIWDADFELLAGRVARATCSGTRAAELALRLKYAGVPEERLDVCHDAEAGLDRALATTTSPPAPLYALPTYTALLDLREVLAARGATARFWE